MWLFFFHDSEHRKLSKTANHLYRYIRETYKYTTWSFKQMDDYSIQVLDGDGDEKGFIVDVEVIP